MDETTKLPIPNSDIDRLNYLLSNRTLINNYFELLTDYLENKLNDYDTEQTEPSKNTYLSDCLLARLIRNVNDGYYNDLYFPLMRCNKTKPGRQTKKNEKI